MSSLEVMDELELIGSVYMYVNIRCASKNEYYTVPVHPGKCKSQMEQPRFTLVAESSELGQGSSLSSN